MSLPATIETFDDIGSMSQYATYYAQLTTLQRTILIELVMNIISEDKKTDIEIAESLQIDRKTIYRARQNPVFSSVLAEMARDVTKGLADRAIGNLVNLKDNVKAQEILLRIAEVYNPTQRILALSGKLPGNSIQNLTSPSGIISSFVSKMVELGYDKTRLTQEIAQVYDNLKADGSI